MKVQTFNTTGFGLSSTLSTDDAEYLSAESSVDPEDLADTIIDDEEDLAFGSYFSLPDIGLLDFQCQLTEPLCPSMSSHQDYDSRYDSFDPPVVSGLLLIQKHAVQRPKIEYVSLKQAESKTSPDFAFLDCQNVQILQSCNGLFLCFSPSSQSYSICSLATQQIEHLPGSPCMSGQCALSLAFNPYKSPHYKIICVQKIDMKKPLYQIAIYSKETCLWSLLGEPFGASGDIDFNAGVFCNGAIHWMRRTSKGLYFDVDSGLIREMPNPPQKEGYSLVSCEYFGESHGHLYYAVASPGLPYLELFQMKEDYTGWVLWSRIDLKALSLDFPIIARKSKDNHPFFPHYECDLLSIVEGCNNEDVEVMLSIPGEVIAYNHEKKSAKTLGRLSLRPDDRAVWYRVYSAYECFEISSV